MNGYNKGNIHVAFNAFCPVLRMPGLVVKSKDAFKSDFSFLCFDPVRDYENPHRTVSLMYSSNTMGSQVRAYQNKWIHIDSVSLIELFSQPDLAEQDIITRWQYYNNDSATLLSCQFTFSLPPPPQPSFCLCCFLSLLMLWL